VLAEQGKPFVAILKKAPLVGEADSEVEIIPYEDLWQLVLDILAVGEPE